MSVKLFKIKTLGCRANQYESQAFRQQFEGMGFREAQSDETADICLVNTCTVTESADRTSLREIRNLAKNNPNTELIITGCAVEGKKEAIAAIPGVSHIAANPGKETLLEELYPELAVPKFSITEFADHTRAFVKVQDGCNSFCTYCIIPYVRGRSRSRPLKDILEEVHGLVASGYKEVVLTGINIGDFDGGVIKGEEPVRLAELVRAVDAVPGLQRLRLSSIDPDEVDEDLADAIINGRVTSPSMHIVLQSGSNFVLKKMNRKYTRQIFFNTVDELRRRNANFTFTTDIIVGFPGESEQDFQDSIDVIKEVQFAKVHMFPYSERARTRAALYDNKVPETVIKERKAKLLQVANQQAFSLREKYVGQVMTVLTEKATKEGTPGHTDNFLPVMIDAQLSVNTLVTVKLTENTPSTLLGQIV